MRVGFFGATKLKRRPSGVFENVSNEAGSPIILTVELLMKIFFRNLEIIYSEREKCYFFSKIKSQTPWPKRNPRCSNLVNGLYSGR